MKQLVVVGDLHLHFWSAFAKGIGANNSRFQKTLENLRLSLNWAREAKCPWVQAGDWIHTVGYSRNLILTQLIKTLGEYDDVQKWTVWGNHDARTAGGPIHSGESVTEILEEAGVVGILNGESYQARNGLTIYGEGYQPNPNELKVVKGLVEGMEDDNLIADVGVFHQTIAGSILPSGMKMKDGLSPNYLFPYFRLAVVGDIHRPQFFDDGDGRKVLVPGSLEQHNFGDHDSRGWWIIDFPEEEDKPLVFGLVPSTSPKFITVEKPEEVRDDGNYYRVTGPCNPDLLPKGAIAVASPPTSIEQRNVINPGSSTRDILEAWLNLSHPEQIGNEKLINEGLRLLESEGTGVLKSIRLRRVDLQNFLCYTEEQFTIQDGVTLVVGQGRDYSSNGAGKTTLFEAVYWGLFGKTTKGIASSEVIQYGKPWGSVELRFDDMMVARRRYRDGTGTLKVLQGGRVWPGGVQEVTSQLQKYLGITPELFQALTYFSQSRLVLFSQATDSERKGMLSDLCGLEIYQKAATAARTAVGQAEQEISTISARTNLLEQHIQAQKELRERLWMQSDAWKKKADEEVLVDKETHAKVFFCMNELTDRWQVVKAHLLQHSESRKAAAVRFKSVLTKKYTEQFEHNLEVARMEKETWSLSHTNLPSVESLRRRRTEVAAEVGEVEEEERHSWESLSKVKHSLSMLQVQLNTIKSQPDICPACGQPIDVSKRDKMAADILRQIELASKELENAKTKLAISKELAVKVRAQLEQIDDIWQSVQEREKERIKLESNISIARLQLENDVEKKVSEEVRFIGIQAQNQVLSRIKVMEKAVSGKLGEYKKEIQELNVKIDRLQSNPYQVEMRSASSMLSRMLDELMVEEKRRDELRESTAIMQYWSEGFSRSGIQSLLMDEVAVSFNQLRSKVFPILTGGVYDVQFSTTSQTSIGEAREKTEFVVRHRGALVSYESLSGGQRRRVDLGVMLTLAMAVSRTRSIPGVLGILILDEVFGFLDQDGVEALYEVLGEVNTVIPSIYAVTHNPSLQSLFRTTILVKQDEYGVSRIQRNDGQEKLE